MEKYDAAIIGGGCGGAAAGYILAKAGKKTIIIDKAVFPRKKICGGMITEKTVSLLKRIYDDADTSEAIDSSCRSFSIYHADIGKICTCSDPVYKLYFVERDRFDDFFLKKAGQAGCYVACGEKAVSVNGNSILMKSGNEVTADYIIGADGANSVSRRHLFPNPNKEIFSIGFQLDVPYESLNCYARPQDIRPIIYFGFINDGYGWIFPKKNIVTVGIGGSVRSNEINMKTLFIRFLRSVMNNPECFLHGIRAFPIPFHNLVKKPARGHFCLVGDAAGLVEPLTGEGIYFALLSGEFAARSIIAGGDCSRRYNRLVGKNIHSFFKQGNFLKKVFFHRTIFLYAMHKMMRNAKYCKYYLKLLAGEITYTGYIKKILRDRKVYPTD